MEALASQSPHSPYHAGILAAPIAQLRRTATTIALVSLGAAWLVPHLAPRREPWLLVGAIVAGSFITIGLLIYAASVGLMGLQIEDPRADARLIVRGRAVGLGFFALALLDAAWRLASRWRRGEG